MAFPITAEQIFVATNGGLDIISRFLDFKDINKHFKIRKEGTESANLFKKDGVWFVKDWGDVNGYFAKSRNAIHVYSHYTGKGYFESILEISKDLGIINSTEVGIKYFKQRTYTQFEKESAVSLNENGFCFEVKEDFTEYELETLGPLVTSEVCKKYSLVALKSYSWLKAEEFKQKELCNVYTIESTPTYPVFGFVIKSSIKPKINLVGDNKEVQVEQPILEKTWVKIYQPKAPDKKYRFSYLGGKPKDYIFGLENAKNNFNKIQFEIEDESEDEEKPTKIKKLERIVICSGDRDAINMASTGETVVWFNSENSDHSEAQILTLYKYAKEVVNVPDLDPTGFEAGKKLALEFLDIKTAWLPMWLLQKKDFRGAPMKDFTDYIKVSSSNYNVENANELKMKVKRLLELARPGKFWIEKYRANKEGQRTSEVSYSINYKNAFNFLRLNGFFRIKDENRKDGWYFVKQNGHVVTEVSVQEIKDFFNRFLDKKQQEKGMRYFPDELLNMLIGSEAVSDKKLINIHTKQFDFVDYTVYSQFLFFDKFIWEVTKDKVVEFNKGYNRYVKETDIINNIVEKQTRKKLNSDTIKVLEPFFTAKKDENNNWDLMIHRKDCDFMNYFINASRVYWKEEVKDLPKGMREDYLKETNFSLANYKQEGSNGGLIDDQVYEQELHFLNKIYAYGYSLHRYKNPAKAWVLYVMDNEVVDDNESHGRTGKSLFANHAIRLFLNSKYVGARKKGLLESDFLYDGVTKETDYTLFDDADKRFPFQQLFTDVTGDMLVNPKNQNAFLIPFFESPKLAITTNYAPFGLDTSTIARILFVSFSDWYHGETDEFPERQPEDDFGCLFFSGWDDHQWNLFFNFSVQCLQFYLGCKEKIGAPTGNIRKRNLISEMGPIFMEWAEDYLKADKLGFLFVKKEAHENLKNYSKTLMTISSNSFKTKMKQYCDYKGYKFCPDHPTQKKDSNGRFMMWHNRNSEEHFYIEVAIEDNGKITENDTEDLFV